MSRVVLLVEDDLANRAVIEDIFEFDDIGADLVCAESGEEAIRLAAERRPILILMDIRLPGMTGLEATRQLKEDEKTRDIPVWALTAYAMTEDREKALAAGCDDYLTKPVDTADLTERLRRCVRESLDGVPAGAGEGPA